MKDRFFLLFLALGGALYGAPPESLALQEMRLALEQTARQLHGHHVEINLFHERILGLERSVEGFKQQLKQGSSEKALEKRLANVEKAQEALISDLKALKNHANESQSSLADCHRQLSKIEEQLSSDVRALKLSLHSMVALLQGTSSPMEEAHTYTVKSGDSLSLIAQVHKTDIKTLKKLNNLTSDTIYSGQKLLIP